MRLTPRQRAIFELRCRDGLARKEVADRLGIALDTVKVQTTVALRRNGLIATDQICYRLERPVPDGIVRAEEV
jgi:DNA-binding NarL/FixJ family response regulator